MEVYDLDHMACGHGQPQDRVNDALTVSLSFVDNMPLSCETEVRCVMVIFKGRYLMVARQKWQYFETRDVTRCNWSHKQRSSSSPSTPFRQRQALSQEQEETTNMSGRGKGGKVIVESGFTPMLVCLPLSSSIAGSRKRWCQASP
jgi:hypothetical protein